MAKKQKQIISSEEFFCRVMAEALILRRRKPKLGVFDSHEAALKRVSKHFINSGE